MGAEGATVYKFDKQNQKLNAMVEGRSYEMGVLLTDEEIAKLEAELAYQQKFLDSVRKKLSNERFVANAPEAVVAVERKKESDSLSKIESITASLNALKS